MVNTTSCGTPLLAGHMGHTEEHVGMAEIRTARRKALPQRPGSSTASRPWLLRHRSHRKIGDLRSEGHQHDILRREDDRRCRAVAFVVEPAGCDAAGRRREANVPEKRVGQKVTPRERDQATIGSMIAWYWSKRVRRTCDMTDRSDSKGRKRFM
jgi:hypothetical protein